MMVGDHLCNRQFGRLAQLVQSVCLTSRGSGVRIPQRPPVTIFIYLFWRFHLAVRIPASHAGYTGSSPVGATSLLYGVMVAREILVLLVWVRVLVQQH